MLAVRSAEVSAAASVPRMAASWVLLMVALLDCLKVDDSGCPLAGMRAVLLVDASVVWTVVPMVARTAQNSAERLVSH
jgi:hypothetical protein